MAVYDVVVVGLGAMGSAATYHLARRGVNVLGIEQFGIAHDRGSSHGQTRVIRQAYYEGPEYVPLLLRAYDLWRELERESSARLLTITGAIRIAPPEAQSVAGAALSARIHNIRHEMLTANEVQRRYPVLRPQAGHVAILEYEAGILVPEACVIKHIELARRHGADVRFDEVVESWTAASDHVKVRTSRGSYETGHVVLTAGPWTGNLLGDISLPLQVTRAVLYWFEPRAHFQEFERLPIYAWQDQGINAYGFPYLDGQGLKAGYHHAFNEITTPETIRRYVDEKEKAQFREHLARFMPDGAGKLLAAATCMYTNTPDLHFVIDRHPAHENVVLACGFSGHGFKFASVLGEVLADLASGREPAQPIGLFALSRFGSTTREGLVARSHETEN